MKNLIKSLQSDFGLHLVNHQIGKNCKVKSGPEFSSSFHFVLVQRVIPPNITLYPLWEELEGGSKVGLLCILSEFYPDKLSVEWLLDDKTVTTYPVQRKLQSVEGEEKTFSLNSQLELDQSQWTQGSEVTCKAIHNAAQGPHPGTTVSRTISICSGGFQ